MKRIIGVTAIGVTAFMTLILPTHIPAPTPTDSPLPGFMQGHTVEAGSRSDKAKRKKKRDRNRKHRDKARERRDERSYCDRHGNHRHAQNRCGRPKMVKCRLLYPMTNGGVLATWCWVSTN